ncbi:unnamed protein product, partial [Prunus brigantina]
SGGGFSAAAQAKKPKNGFIPCAYLNGTNHQMVQTYHWLTINRLLHSVREGGLVSKQSRNSILLLAYWLEATPSIIQPFRCSEGHGDRTSPVPHRAQKNFSKCGAHMRAKVAGNLVT